MFNVKTLFAAFVVALFVFVAPSVVMACDDLYCEKDDVYPWDYADLQHEVVYEEWDIYMERLLNIVGFDSIEELFYLLSTGQLSDDVIYIITHFELPPRRTTRAEIACCESMRVTTVLWSLQAWVDFCANCRTVFRAVDMWGRDMRYRLPHYPRFWG
ncbi:MAG: hypothetical protein FWE05_01925 [Defluviitaleaceae bacterium]|nr:hypothetical protein [Defluviitaleaceae bacterium]